MTEPLRVEEARIPAFEYETEVPDRYGVRLLLNRSPTDLEAKFLLDSFRLFSEASPQTRWITVPNTTVEEVRDLAVTIQRALLEASAEAPKRESRFQAQKAKLADEAANIDWDLAWQKS